MARDYQKLRVFHLADELVPEVYRLTADFPASERFGLQAQIRRAALSVPANIVEGSARRSSREYINFLNVATGSAAEVEYLVDVSRRLQLVDDERARVVVGRYRVLLRGLQAMLH